MYKCLDVGNGADGQQVYAQYDAPAGHILGRHLAPTPRRRTEVNADLCTAEKIIFLVDLVCANYNAKVVLRMAGHKHMGMGVIKYERTSRLLEGSESFAVSRCAVLYSGSPRRMRVFFLSLKTWSGCNFGVC